MSYFLKTKLKRAITACARVAVLGLRPEIEAIVQEALHGDARDLKRTALRSAAQQTADWIAGNLNGVKLYQNKYELLSACVEASLAVPQGLYAEFGVFNGRTINHIASCLPDTTLVHGFDSFEGLPEDWHTELGKGSFAVDQLPRVRANVRLHKGWFSATLAPFAAVHKGPMALMHMDADLYSSTKTIFEVFADRIVPGTVIQFDEYFNYPGWRAGEYAAFEELVAETGLHYRFLGYCNGEQLALQIV